MTDVMGRDGMRWDCSMQMMWSCWPHRSVTSNPRWIDSQLSKKLLKLRISTSNSEAMVLSQKKMYLSIFVPTLTKKKQDGEAL